MINNPEQLLRLRRPPIKERRLYDSVQWRKVAKRFLSANPLCAICREIGRDTAATTVHHKIKHEGNVELFWDEDNFESVCASCHSGIVRVVEHHGFSQACDINGLPLDSNHPFNKRRK